MSREEVVIELSSDDECEVVYERAARVYLALSLPSLDNVTSPELLRLYLIVKKIFEDPRPKPILIKSFVAVAVSILPELSLVDAVEAWFFCIAQPFKSIFNRIADEHKLVWRVIGGPEANIQMQFADSLLRYIENVVLLYIKKMGISNRLSQVEIVLSDSESEQEEEESDDETPSAKLVLHSMKHVRLDDLEKLLHNLTKLSAEYPDLISTDPRFRNQVKSLSENLTSLGLELKKLYDNESKEQDHQSPVNGKKAWEDDDDNDDDVEPEKKIQLDPKIEKDGKKLKNKTSDNEDQKKISQELKPPTEEAAETSKKVESDDNGEPKRKTPKLLPKPQKSKLDKNAMKEKELKKQKERELRKFQKMQAKKSREEHKKLKRMEMEIIQNCLIEKIIPKYLEIVRRNNSLDV